MHEYLTVNMKPGANIEVFTNAVASAGENPDDIHIPVLKPNDALVSLRDSQVDSTEWSPMIR